MAVTVRPVTRDDLGVCTVLIGQLGYNVDQTEIVQRFAVVEQSAGHQVFVLDAEGRVVGLVHGFLRPALEKSVEVVVQSLVIAREDRGRGFGQMLMDAIEGGARSWGVMSVVLASQNTRTASHAFYERLDYRRMATSHVFRKTL